MALNQEIEVFGVPQIYKNRFYHPYTVRRKTSGNVGEIIPIYNNILVQPGDTFSIAMRSFFKMTTSLFPSMDNLKAQIFAFAQDWQNNWVHTKEFWGEDEATPFETLPEYTIPQVTLAPAIAVENHDIMHHLAIPIMQANKGAISSVTRAKDIECERLSYNTYIDIYNYFFRDQNYIKKIEFSKGDEDIKYEELPQIKLLKAARFHDYFAGTPQAQKGEPEFLPLGTEAPVQVYGNGKTLAMTDGTNVFTSQYRGTEGLYPGTAPLGSPNGIATNNGKYTQYITSGVATLEQLNNIGNNSGIEGIADLTNTVGATLNALRLITVSQHIKEELMWYGSRFNEIIFSQWGVQINAATMRIPEFLGSITVDINMDTVLQTSSTDSESPQGNSAGYSVTFDESHLFTKSFTTWQNIMILCVIRQDHTYAQGLANQHSKKRKYDFYWDAFAGIGAQPRKISEIALTGTASDSQTWNFAPAWREYISEVDRTCGLLTPGIPDTLANQTYTDEYSTVPNSGAEWIEETPVYVDRTLVAPSTTTDQFIMDFVFDVKKTSIVPNFRLPGIDKL